MDFTGLVNYGAIGICLLASGGFAFFLTKFLLEQLKEITATNKLLAEAVQKYNDNFEDKLDTIIANQNKDKEVK